MNHVTLTAAKIAEMVNGKLIGSPDRTISSVSGIRDAQSDQLSFIGNKKYQHQLESTKAGVVLVCPDLADAPAVDRTLIVCENVDYAFATVIAVFAEEPPKWPVGVHPSAVVSPDAKLGQGVSINANAVIEAGAEIGDGTVIGAGCYIGHDVKIGAGSLLYPNVTVMYRCVIGRKAVIHPGVVIGGDKGKVGAALLAARAALKLGAGSVTVELMAPNAPLYDPAQPELMITDEPVDFSNADVIVIGCGLGFSQKAKERLVAAVRSDVPLIIDADALTMISQDQSLEDEVLARKAHTVITPHPGEAARMLHRDVKSIQEDRVTSARELSLQTGAITVLKGTGTVVTLRSSRSWINPTGNACLATAGSGDVLAGMIGAFFAQKFDIVSATLGAVWLHGEAVRARNTGIVAMDICDRAARALEILRWGGNPDDLVDPYDESEFVLDEDGPGEAIARTMGSEEN